MLFVKTWLTEQFDIKIKEKQILFSFEERNDEGNSISLLVKYFIYKSKFKDLCRHYLSVHLFQIHLKQNKSLQLSIHRRKMRIMEILKTLGAFS